MPQKHDEDNSNKAAEARGYLAAGVAASAVDAKVIGGG